jgi:hypothetical protein
MKPQGLTSAKKAFSSAERRFPAQPKIAARWLSAASSYSIARSLIAKPVSTFAAALT